VVKRALDEIETKNTGIKQSLVLTSADWQSYAEGALSMAVDIRKLIRID